MYPVSKIRLYRFLEKLALVLMVVWTAGVLVLAIRGAITTDHILAITITFSFLLGIILLVQRAVDNWLELSVSQSNYAEEDVFRSLYDRSPVAYFTLDSKGMITNSNQAANYLLRASSGQIIGLSLTTIIVTEESEEANVLWEKLMAGLTVNEEELPIKTISGELVWTMISVVPYRNAGDKLVSLVDITEQKNIDTAKSEFVALATHQLRTPIAAIRWNVELLVRSLRGVETEAQSRYLEKVDRNVHRMINLINDFLSVSKLEMGTYAADIEKINMTEFFDAILDEYAEKITEKNLTINREEDPPQFEIETDNRLFHIIISNLVSNATKYAKSDGSISLSYAVQGEQVEIVIADNGIGIPEKELTNLFTKFYRATNAQSHQTEGTGLGLYIVKESIMQLGGQIDVKSDTNQGAEFTIKMPIRIIGQG